MPATSPTDQPDLTPLAQNGVRRHALRARDVASSLGGVATVTVLALFGLEPLITGIIAHTLAPEVVRLWLGGLGANALAGWLASWAERTGNRLLPNGELDDALRAELAADLQRKIAADADAAAALAALIEQVEVLAVAFEALGRQRDAQTALLESLRSDMRRSDLIQGRLHQVLVTALDMQTGTILAAIAQGTDRLSEELRALATALREELRQQAGGKSIRVSASATVQYVAESSTAQVTGAVINAPNAQTIIIQAVTTLARPIPPSTRAAIQRMVTEYVAVFGGRDAELTALDAFLAQDARPYALLLAPTGRGKTALLIHWVVRVQVTGDWCVVFVPISLRYETATANVVLGALASALADYYGEADQLQTYTMTPDLLRPVITDYLHRPASHGRRLLIVLDGLDEATGWSIGRTLFPYKPEPHLRVVASARQLANTTAADWCDRLGWDADRTFDVGLPMLSHPAVADILRRMGNPLDALATQINVLSEITRVSQGDPLTIKFLIEALQKGTLTPEGLSQMPPGLEAYVRDWLIELRQQSTQAETVYELLALCAVALGPLASADLQVLAPERFARQAVLQEAADVVGRFIIGDGREESGYVFSHPRLRELFVEKVLSMRERDAVQQRFITYGQEWYAQYRQQQIKVEQIPAYLRQFWVSHLALAGQWDTARQVLIEVVPIGQGWVQPWAAARFAAEGSYAGYLGDLDRLWLFAEESGDLALGVCCALIASSIRSLSSNLTPELLVGLVTVGTPEGKWSPAAALEHIRYMSGQTQLAAFRALLTCGCAVPYQVAMDIAVSISEDGGRAQALGFLIPSLPTDLLPLALESTRTIVGARARVEVLGQLGSHLPPGDQAAVYTLALESARAIADARVRAEVLGKLASHLPPSEQAAVYTLALESARTIANEEVRAEVLSQLAPHLPPGDQAAVYTLALESARTIMDEEARAEMLGQIAPHLPPSEQAAVYTLALESARTIANEEVRAEVLSQLAPHLPPSEQAAIYTLILESVRTIANDWVQTEVLGLLAPHLPAELLPLALESARAIVDAGARAEVLGLLAPHLPPSEQAAIYTLALESVRTIANARARAGVLGPLAPHLPAELLPLALESARAIADARARAKVLGLLVPHLPPSEQAAIYTLALESTRTIVDARARAEVLGQLVQHLPPSEQPAVYTLTLESAHAIVDEEAQARMLGQLAPYLPAELLHLALESARGVANDGVRAKMLVQLAPHLPAELLPLALETARGIANDGTRARVLGQLVPHLPAELLPLALETARAIANDGARAEVLRQFAPHLPAELLPLALESARAIANDGTRARVLGQLAPHLPAELLPLALESARAIANDGTRARVLSQLVPHLSPSDQAATYTLALESARAVANDRVRAEVLGQLAMHLPADLLLLVLESAHAIANDWARAEALEQLVPYLPTELLPLALESTYVIADDGVRAAALGQLASYLPPSDQAVVFARALDSARAIVDEAARARMLGQLTPHLPAELLPLALESARAITNDWARVEALGQIALHLPLSEQAAVYTLALESVRAITNEGARAEVLGQLAPLLPSSDQTAVYALALESARAIVDDRVRAEVLGQLAPHLPPSDQTAVYTLALESGHAIADARARAEVLGQLAPHLPSTEQAAVYARILESARTIADDRVRAEVLEQLASHLPSELLHLALDSARTITDNRVRAKVLGLFAPQLATFFDRSTPTASAPWNQTIRLLAGRGRPVFLADLAALTPWLLARAAPKNLAAIANAITDIAHCWP